MKKSIFDKHSVFILVIISVCLAIFISTNTQQIQANNNISKSEVISFDFVFLDIIPPPHSFAFLIAAEYK